MLLPFDSILNDETEEESDSEETLSNVSNIDFVSQDEQNDSNFEEEQSELDLSNFELMFAKLCLEYKVTEKLGDAFLNLVHDFGIQSRKTKTLMKKLAENSFQHYKYALCSNCNSIVTKLAANIACLKCNSVVQSDEMTEYVSFDIPGQIQILSKQFELLNDVNEPLELQILMTADGVPLSRSSYVELLPVTMFIQNFSDLNVRSSAFLIGSIALAKKKRLTLSKLSKAKISPSALIEPISRQIKRINDQNGISTSWSKQTTIKIVGFIADAPCRALFLNVLSHNGTFPCHRCLIKTTEKKIPIITSSEIVPKNLNQVRLWAKEAADKANASLNVNLKPNVFGVKGISTLDSLNFDYIQRTPFEVMHCLFLGFVRRFLDWIINNLNKSSREQIDRRILTIKPPSNIKRNLRCLAEFANFKSAEFEIIFFYYGQFIFYGLIDQKMYELMFFLSSATFKLWSRRMPMNIVNQAEIEIDHFLHCFKEWNREPDLQTYNLHCLVHLFEDRTTFGPLCKVNAYGYENELQHLKTFLPSRNPKLETVAKKIKSERWIKVPKNFKIEFFDKSFHVPELFMQTISKCMNLTLLDIKKANFFGGFKNRFLNVTCKSYEKRKNNFDSFVKCYSDYFTVLAIFCYNNIEFCFLEQIETETQRTIALNSLQYGMVSKIYHTYPIKRLKSEKFKVVQIDSVKRQVSYVQIENNLKTDFGGFTEFIIEIEN